MPEVAIHRLKIDITGCSYTAKENQGFRLLPTDLLHIQTIDWQD